MVLVRVQRIGVPILDRFAARLSERTNEDWAKWQLCRYAEVAVEMICCGLQPGDAPVPHPEFLFEEGRAPTFGDFRNKAQILVATKVVDDSAWGARFFARVVQDEVAARALEIINAQRNDLAHGRRSLSLVEIKKHVTKGLKLESRVVSRRPTVSSRSQSGNHGQGRTRLNPLLDRPAAALAKECLALSGAGDWRNLQSAAQVSCRK